jgi:hypothetical protein
VAVPVEFLTDHEATAFGRYGGCPSREELERFFFLDDGHRKLVCRRRGDHNRLGFGVGPAMELERTLSPFCEVRVGSPSTVAQAVSVGPGSVAARN